MHNKYSSFVLKQTVIAMLNTCSPLNNKAKENKLRIVQYIIYDTMSNRSPLFEGEAQ